MTVDTKPLTVVPPLTVLSDRERMIRIVRTIIESPLVANSPVGPFVNLYRRAIAEKLRTMTEPEAHVILTTLRELVN